jgi:hypothetical protein
MQRIRGKGQSDGYLLPNGSEENYIYTHIYI